MTFIIEYVKLSAYKTVTITIIKENESKNHLFFIRQKAMPELA